MPPPAQKLVLVEEATGRPVVLRRHGTAGGAQSTIWAVENNPGLFAAVALAAGGYPTEDSAKLRALVEKRLVRKRVAAPVGVLVTRPGDAAAAGFLMPKVLGEGLDVVSVPAEQKRLGVLRDQTERLAGVASLARLFRWAEGAGVVQADHNPPNYLFDPTDLEFGRVDALAFAFDHNGYHGTGVARPELVGPEYQRFVRTGTLSAERLSQYLDRFALAALAFLVLTGALPTDYTGGDPDPGGRIERREFACVSEPAGCTVNADVRLAYFSLPKDVRGLIEGGLLAEPHNRPAPDAWVAALGGARPQVAVRSTWPTWPGGPVAAARRAWPTAAGVAALAGAVGWSALVTPKAATPAAPQPVATPEHSGPRQPNNPDAWQKLTRRAGDP